MPGMMKKATPSPKPTKTPVRGKVGVTPRPGTPTSAQKSAAAQAEAMFKKLLKEGKVKNITETRKMIAKKYGVSPNGFTN